MILQYLKNLNNKKKLIIINFVSYFYFLRKINY